MNISRAQLQLHILRFVVALLAPLEMIYIILLAVVVIVAVRDLQLLCRNVHMYLLCSFVCILRRFLSFIGVPQESQRVCVWQGGRG